MVENFLIYTTARTVSMEFLDDAPVHDRNCARVVFERDEYQLLPIRKSGHWLRKVIDVGASYGAFSRMVWEIFPNCVISAYEPNRRIFPILQKNVGSQVAYLEEAALGGKAGSVYFRDFFTSVSSQTGEVPADYEVHLEGESTYKAEQRLLSNHHFFLGGLAVDLLKLDCEASEGAILQDLRDNDKLHLIRWIRGEWHGKTNLEMCRECLAKTHVAHFHDTKQGNGFFLAHNIMDG